MIESRHSIRRLKRLLALGFGLTALAVAGFVAVLYAQSLGLGNKESFVLYRWIGVTRSGALAGAAVVLLAGLAIAGTALDLLVQRRGRTAFRARASSAAHKLGRSLRSARHVVLTSAIVLATVTVMIGIDRIYGALSTKAPDVSSPFVPPPVVGEWAELQKHESAAYSRSNYLSFQTWGYRDYRSAMVNIENGVRATVQPPRTQGAPERVVWFFGGSTMLGQGSDDANTIPSHTCRYLARYWPQFNWRCVNHGIGGYVSTQEMVRMLVLLRDQGDGATRPDAVVFYDGVNDFIAALQGHPGEHHEFAYIKEKLGARVDLPMDRRRMAEQAVPLNQLWARLVEHTGRAAADYLFPNIFKAFGDYQSRASDASEPADLTAEAGTVLDRARAAARLYVGLRRVCADNLSQAKFKIIFSLQPTKFGRKPHVAEEDWVLQRPYTGFKYAALMAQFWAAYYNDIRAAGFEKHGQCHSVDLTGVFDDDRRPVFFDWMHVYPLGNQMVAHALAAAIANDLERPPAWSDAQFDAATLENGQVRLSKALR